tara:strand:+ start:128 stop:769 length:642 start_codon:yes stop_codon:yes gene_type:complete
VHKIHKVVGLSGLAGSGKDLFCEVLCEKDPTFVRYALADELKRGVRDLFIEEHDIDILNCSREEKDKIRPHLVEIAKERRIATEGRHWVNFLERRLIPLTDSVCITDVRYDDYDHDEVFWLRVQMDGVLVHISRYDLIDGEKVFLSPPNEEEKRNDPQIKDKADYVIEWPTFEGDKEALKAQVSERVSDFLSWLPLWKQKKRKREQMMNSLEW